MHPTGDTNDFPTVNCEGSRVCANSTTLIRNALISVALVPMSRKYIFNPCNTVVSDGEVCFPNVAYRYANEPVSDARANQLKLLGGKLRSSCEQFTRSIKNYTNKFTLESEEVRVIMYLLVHLSYLDDAKYNEIRLEFCELFPHNFNPKTSSKGRMLGTFKNKSFMVQSEIRCFILGFLDAIKFSKLPAYVRKQSIDPDRNRILYDFYVCIAGILAGSFLQQYVRVFRTKQSFGGMGLKLCSKVVHGQFLALTHLLPTNLRRFTGLKHERGIKDGQGLFGLGLAINSSSNNNVLGMHTKLFVGEYKTSAEVEAEAKAKTKPFVLNVVEFIAAASKIECDTEEDIELFWIYDV